MMREHLQGRIDEIRCPEIVMMDLCLDGDNQHDDEDEIDDNEWPLENLMMMMGPSEVSWLMEQLQCRTSSVAIG
jgi:hypothetical protein